jgi:hypothetical protein
MEVKKQEDVKASPAAPGESSPETKSKEMLIGQSESEKKATLLKVKKARMQ